MAKIMGGVWMLLALTSNAYVCAVDSDCPSGCCVGEYEKSRCATSWNDPACSTDTLRPAGAPCAYDG